MQKTAYVMRISDWSSDVCSSDLVGIVVEPGRLRAKADPRCHLAAAGAIIQPRRQDRHAHPALAIVVRALQQRRGLSGIHRRRSEEHTPELQSLMRISYAVFCLNKKNPQYRHQFRKKHQKPTHHEYNERN